MSRTNKRAKKVEDHDHDADIDVDVAVDVDTDYDLDEVIEAVQSRVRPSIPCRRDLTKVSDSDIFVR
jgi:hypothetical protein